MTVVEQLLKRSTWFVQVTLRPVSEYLALTVPGLAEGRPSLLVGDRVVLSDSEVAGYAPSYEGCIHEVSWSSHLLTDE